MALKSSQVYKHRNSLPHLPNKSKPCPNAFCVCVRVCCFDHFHLPFTCILRVKWTYLYFVVLISCCCYFVAFIAIIPVSTTSLHRLIALRIGFFPLLRPEKNTITPLYLVLKCTLRNVYWKFCAIFIAGKVLRARPKGNWWLSKGCCANLGALQVKHEPANCIKQRTNGIH